MSTNCIYLLNGLTVDSIRQIYHQRQVKNRCTAEIQARNRQLTLSMLRGTDSSFQPAPGMTIVLFIVTALPHQVGL